MPTHTEIPHVFTENECEDLSPAIFFLTHFKFQINRKGKHAQLFDCCGQLFSFHDKGCFLVVYLRYFCIFDGFLVGFIFMIYDMRRLVFVVEVEFGCEY